MALDISNVTIGYDYSGMLDALDKIKLEVIDQTKEAMENNIVNLGEWVNEAWVGKSADIFYYNMTVQQDRIANALDVSYKELYDEFNKIIQALDKVDSELIKKEEE